MTIVSIRGSAGNHPKQKWKQKGFYTTRTSLRVSNRGVPLIPLHPTGYLSIFVSMLVSMKGANVFATQTKGC